MFGKQPATAFSLLLLSIASFTILSASVHLANAQFESVRFAVLGDFGDGSDVAASVARMVKSWDADFIITTGDNNYPNGTADTIDPNIGQFYSEYIFNYNGSYGVGSPINRFFPSLGNHDYESDPTAQPYFDYFTLPGNERYYDFIWGPLHFFAVNSNLEEPDGISIPSIQSNWLQEQLAQSQSTWNIVYMHHPPYSSGTKHEPTSELRWPYTEWGASAVLSGHSHNYERLVVDGLPYLVVGAGTESLHGFEQPELGSVVRYNDAPGAMLVEANEESITFQFYSLLGLPLSGGGEAVRDVWSTFDVTPAVQGNGIYSFGLVSLSSNGVEYNSREADSNPPELVVEVQYPGVADTTLLVFYPTDDTYVSELEPDDNFNSSTDLRVQLDHEGTTNAYLKFELQGIDGIVQSAELRLYVTNPSRTSGYIYTTANTFLGTHMEWTEDDLTWLNAPPLDGLQMPIDEITLFSDTLLTCTGNLIASFSETEGSERSLTGTVALTIDSMNNIQGVLTTADALINMSGSINNRGVNLIFENGEVVLLATGTSLNDVRSCNTTIAGYLGGLEATTSGQWMLNLTNVNR